MFDKIILIRNTASLCYINCYFLGHGVESYGLSSPFFSIQEAATRFSR